MQNNSWEREKLKLHKTHLPSGGGKSQIPLFSPFKLLPENRGNVQDEHPFFILRDSCYEALQMASSIHILLHILGPEGVVEIPHHGIDLLIFLLFKLGQEKILSASGLWCPVRPRRNRYHGQAWLSLLWQRAEQQLCCVGLLLLLIASSVAAGKVIFFL